MKLLTFCAAIISVGVIVIIAAHFQQPSSGNTYGNQDGRYRLIVTTSTSGNNYGTTSLDKQYVIDTETGRVWHSVVDAQKSLIVFESSPYENLDRQLSFIPNESTAALTL